MEEKNKQSPYKKPPWYVQLFLTLYGLLWLNMLFIAGLNSLYLGYIDYDSLSLWAALSAGLWLIFKYLPRLL